MAVCMETTQDGALATVVLENAGKFNAMSRSMWRELRVVFSAAAQQPGLRCIVVKGADGHFCAGGDIAEYPAFRFDPHTLQAFHEDDVWGALQAMLDCDVPLLAQIEGNCMGAGLEIASCCDLRWASTNARFGAPIAKLGFPMAPREAALVAGAVGHTTARAMLLAAAVLDAQHMLHTGFLTGLCAPTEIAAHCSAQALSITMLAPQAARMNKQTLRALNRAAEPMDSAGAAPDLIAIDLNSAACYDYADSPEHREGIAAFLAKRPPVF
ncbi:MAG: enoyl-CoA hydratase [Burkholderiales bacterium PBB3]|nr:MAG: enoyl-CoA hydratase [Burkholderiales bacterium PBB3]